VTLNFRRSDIRLSSPPPLTQGELTQGEIKWVALIEGLTREVPTMRGLA
jgi:hypothetical protein